MSQFAKLYGRVMMSAFGGEINWTSDTIQALLVGPSYTPNQDTHQYLSDITNELSGSGYARVTLGSKSKTYDATTNATILTAGPISFASLSGSYRYMVVAKSTGTAGTSPLIGWLDFGSTQTVVSQPVVVTPGAEGLFVHGVV